MKKIEVERGREKGREKKRKREKLVQRNLSDIIRRRE